MFVSVDVTINGNGGYTMKKKMETMFYIICVIIIAWVMICWINVVIHNGNANYEYPAWNLFTWLATKGGN